ncbi:MAG: hypothetical protein IKJ45_04895, partial [Kiritimatiellae bacterium]|nr:hypothetical protein [Kiritimatiellia bacterium]
DEKNRLRSTTYLDGTFITNAYSCCRLLWRQDREGRKMFRSAKTGTDHLYNAEEDVWLGDISANGQYRITQHFIDAIGRETNTVVYAGSAPGEAVEASASDGKVHSCETTEYPYGGDDYAVHTDERGKVTVSRTDILPDSIESADSVFTNGVEVVKTKSRTYFGGGSSMRREWNGDKWTEERRFTDYAADGKRIDYVVTESSDNGVVTNSVSTYDLLGRLVTQETALGTVTYHYDEASPRMTGLTTIAENITRESTFLYDDYAEQVGVLRDGVTTRTDTAYETDASNIVWRVTAERTFGESTNACIITKERLTGLCNECRSSVLKSDLSGAWMRIDKSFDEALGLETEKTESSSAETVSAIKKNGLTIRTLADSESAFNAYDALGRIVSTSRKTGEGDALPYQSFDYAFNGDLLATHTYTNTADIITESYAYDKLGNRVETTDALGNTVFRSYDPFGNIISECGATYPVRYTYDTQNRRTSLATTRDGANWDVTSWTYDASTGLCKSKTYADGTQVLYTHTPDGLALRTTYPSGRWAENVYNERR